MGFGLENHFLEMSFGTEVLRETLSFSWRWRRSLHSHCLLFHRVSLYNVFSLPRIVNPRTVIDDIQEHVMQTDGKIIFLFSHVLSITFIN